MALYKFSPTFLVPRKRCAFLDDETEVSGDDDVDIARWKSLKRKAVDDISSGEI